jgi:hypothetical protein
MAIGGVFPVCKNKGREGRRDAQQKDIFFLSTQPTTINWCQLPHCHMALCIKSKNMSSMSPIAENNDAAKFL